MKIYTEPQLVLLISNPESGFRFLVFVSCGENLFAVDSRDSRDLCKIHRLDTDKMKWVSSINTQEKYAFFRQDDFSRHGYSYTLREVWVDIRSQYGRCANKKGKGMLFQYLSGCLLYVNDIL